MVPKVDIRRVTTLTPAQLREAADVVARTFHDHPYMASLFPNASRRLIALRLLFASALKDGMRFGHVDIAEHEKIVGVLISYPPGTYPMSSARMVRLLPDFIRLAAVSPMGLVRLMRTKHRLDPLHPKEPYLYGFCIGIEVGGVGNSLLKCFLDEADRMGLPIYAETQSKTVVRWVRAVGFKILREGIEMFPGGPLAWTIWREPKRRINEPESPA